ncbi:MAG TPA: S8 family serine peptidase [Chloroflexia bacterium]|nr:S8 family serine peptidase [Chloroflexia bacterium]
MGGLGPPRPPAAEPTAGAIALFVIGVLGIGLLVLVGQPVVWFVRQIVLALDRPWPPLLDSLAVWVAALLISVPAALAGRGVTAPRLRAAFQTWAAASLALAALGVARLFPGEAIQPAALVQIAVGVLGAALLRWARRRRAGAIGGRAPGTALAGALAALLAIPWLLTGALGSWLDTALTLAAGLSLGLLAAGLIATYLLPGLAAYPISPGRDIGFGGLVIGLLLLILAAGAGPAGSHVLLLVALPPLGFVVAAIAGLAGGSPRAGAPVALLIGGCAAAPLLLFDPAELDFSLGFDDVLGLAFAGALGAAGLALGISLLAWIFPAPLARLARSGWRYAVLAGAVGLAAAIYLLAGRPGFYGDQLFVILRDQADVQPAAHIADRAARLRWVYTTLTHQATTSQADLRATLDRAGIHYTPYYLVNALEVDGDAPVRLYLESRPEVDRVLPSPRLRPLLHPPQAAAGTAAAPPQPQWNITMIGADRVWRELGVTGTGIVIGQSDSGVDGTHPALQPGYRGRNGQNAYNWLDPWYGAPAPVDYGGHGTHTLGSALGRGGIGVAPGAEWIGCTNLARNLGNPPRYLDCLQFMLAPYPAGQDPFTAGDPARAAHVLTNSWGCPPREGCDAGSLAAATRALRAAGIFVVVSAGNSGPDCGSVTDPLAIYDSVVSVGAVNARGDLADFSSRGPVTVDGSGRGKPDLVAPGEEVLSAFPHNSYEVASGTSMAGPHVAGVVALMWSANPRLIGDIDRTEQLLLATARPYPRPPPTGCAASSGGVSDAFGHGLVDAYAAVQAARAAR